ncbi:MAG: ATP-grasp domain-containing protein, partial [Desulfamplus sp.]|nr:ATP-grasp domain-containing protein [Desulfamplus sp.]
MINTTKSSKTVLLTGGGGTPIPALIKSLREQGYRVLVVDMDPYASGLFLADKGIVIPPAKDSHFADTLKKICREEHVNILVPLVDEELLICSQLEGDNLIVITPRSSFIEICLDKLKLAQTLVQVGIAVPETRLVSDGWEKIVYPQIIKPRTGRGSRGVQVVYSSSEIDLYLKDTPYKPEELLLQEYIDGTEFTTSVVVWRDGEIQAVVPKEIINKKGVTRLAVTRKNPQIDQLCRTIQEKLKADGPFNVQLRLSPKDGTPLPFEINPRFSTTITQTMAAGVDELGGVI